MTEKFLPKGTLASIGMEATLTSGSDTYGGKITWTSSSRREAVFLEHGSTRGERVSLRKDGYYRPQGSPINGGRVLYLGLAETYRDPHI